MCGTLASKTRLPSTSFETASTRSHCYPVEMADDGKMMDRGDAASGLEDSKQDFKTFDGGRAVLGDTEASIQEDVEVAKVEAVYRYVIAGSYS